MNYSDELVSATVIKDSWSKLMVTLKKFKYSELYDHAAGTIKGHKAKVHVKQKINKASSLCR
jgi:hypothetical protein